jgi:hypothetical protein
MKRVELKEENNSVRFLVLALVKEKLPIDIPESWYKSPSEVQEFFKDIHRDIYLSEDDLGIIARFGWFWNEDSSIIDIEAGQKLFEWLRKNKRDERIKHAVVYNNIS